MNRWRRLLVVVPALLGLLATGATAADAPLVAGATEYWQHIGFSFPPCSSIVWRPNLEQAREPAEMRAILTDAVTAWNNAIGSAVMSVGPDTTASADTRFDGINTLEVITSSRGGFGGVGGPSTAERGGEDVITEGDVKIFDFDGLPLDQTVRDVLLLSMIHEMGHAIGFLHTIDPASPMSYVSDPGGAIDVPTRRVAAHLLAAPCGSHPRVQSSIDLFDTFARGKDVDYQHVSRQFQPLLDNQVTDVVSAGASLAHRRLDEPGAILRAVICRDDAFPDCLAGSGLAGEDGLVLFVPGGPSGRLPATVRTVLARAFGAGRAAADVIIVGGPNAVSEDVRTDLEAEGYPVRRLRGVAPNADRFGTAERIAQDVVDRGGGAVDTVLLARGDNPADAMTAGVVAARDDLPLVLTSPGALPEVTRAALQRWRPRRIVLLGGPAAVSEQVASQVAAYADVVQRARGVERTATSVAIARDLVGYRSIDQSPRPITLLDGRHPSAWALAIGYAPLGAVQNSPVLLTESNGFLPATPPSTGAAPGTGLFLADLDLSPSHDGGPRTSNDPFFRSLGTSDGLFTPAESMLYADQILLYCRWYADDCFQEGLA